jgi:cytochrome b pre-mRNA-processing protein 3
LNPLNPPFAWRRQETSAAKLYGAIVAQTRLPLFYREFGVPDTLEGRFVLLSLHLFAVLHRLKTEGTVARDVVADNLVQELIDRFSEDMETVLRELGVSDFKIPKKVRGLATASSAWLQAYEEAFAAGDGALATTIAAALPLEGEPAKAAGGRLAHYLKGVVRHMEAEAFAALKTGEVRFAEVSAISGQELGDI